MLNITYIAGLNDREYPLYKKEVEPAGKTQYFFFFLTR